jgi:hypothetical protein
MNPKPENSCPLNWDRIKHDFSCDGSLRDIYVTPANIDDWRSFYCLLLRHSEGEFLINGSRTAAPKTVDEVFSSRSFNGPLIKVRVGHAWLITHFFSRGEIEMSFNPNDVASESDFAALLQFIRSVGDTLLKPVLITPENLPEHPIVSYSPTVGEFQYFPIPS